MTLQDLGSIGEFVAAAATVATLFYLALQIRTSNRLARAEASRAPNSDLNALNAAFGTDPVFRAAMRQILAGAKRSQLDPDQRAVVDFHMISVTNTQDQLWREMKAGILDPQALDFGGAGLFLLPYYQTSWPLYRPFLSSGFATEFEVKYDLDPLVEAEW